MICEYEESAQFGYSTSVPMIRQDHSQASRPKVSSKVTPDGKTSPAAAVAAPHPAQTGRVDNMSIFLRKAPVGCDNAEKSDWLPYFPPGAIVLREGSDKTLRGECDYGSGMVPTMGTQGLIGNCNHTTPGGVLSLPSRRTSPRRRNMEPVALLALSHRRSFTKKIDMFVYTPGLRRGGRQPQPRRGRRFPNQAFTFDDTFGRDAGWSWRIIGTGRAVSNCAFLVLANPSPSPTPAERCTTCQSMKSTPWGKIIPRTRPMVGFPLRVEAKVREDWLPGYTRRVSCIGWISMLFILCVSKEYDYNGN